MLFYNVHHVFCCVMYHSAQSPSTTHLSLQAFQSPRHVKERARQWHSSFYLLHFLGVRRRVSGMIVGPRFIILGTHAYRNSISCQPLLTLLPPLADAHVLGHSPQSSPFKTAVAHALNPSGCSTCTCTPARLIKSLKSSLDGPSTILLAVGTRACQGNESI
jgi:hypothetical protein